MPMDLRKRYMCLKVALCDISPRVYLSAACKQTKPSKYFNSHFAVHHFEHLMGLETQALARSTTQNEFDLIK